MQEIRVGLIGLGTVGRGVVQLLETHRARLTSRVGASIRVTCAAVRALDKHADFASRISLTTSPLQIATSPDVDLVVEVAGGIDAPYTWVKAALQNGKSVITANKALLAAHGPELFAIAKEKNVDLSFEAAVAGGIPVLRALRESLAGDDVQSIRGIVNGTSNYILTRMHEAGLGFDVALKEAQDAGYAEADPTLDVGGGDAAHKLVVLTMLAFGAAPALSNVAIEGITHVSARDIHYAKSFGYVIKLLAVAARNEDALDVRVHPTLVPAAHPIANARGALNAVFLQGKAVGPLFFSGPGAGALPTATSVVGDLVDLAHRFARKAGPRLEVQISAQAATLSDPGDHRGRYYLRFTVKDRPGVLGRIATILGAYDVSIERMLQDGRATEDAPVTIVVLTHEARNRDVRAALAEIDALAHIADASRALRIDEAI